MFCGVLGGIWEPPKQGTQDNKMCNTHVSEIPKEVEPPLDGYLDKAWGVLYPSSSCNKQGKPNSIKIDF